MSEQTTELITAFLMIIGTFFMFVSAVGVVKMPDLFMRMSSSTKSATMGVTFVLLSAVVYFSDDFGSASRIVAVIVFVFITAPVAAHMIGRAGYFSGSELWHRTVVDELETRHDADRLPLRRALDAEDRINPDKISTGLYEQIQRSEEEKPSTSD